MPFVSPAMSRLVALADEAPKPVNVVLSKLYSYSVRVAVPSDRTVSRFIRMPASIPALDVAFGDSGWMLPIRASALAVVVSMKIGITAVRLSTGKTPQ